MRRFENVPATTPDDTAIDPYVQATATPLYKLKTMLPLDPTDTIHDVRLSHLLRQAELEIGAPNGMIKYVLAQSPITFYPDRDYLRLYKPKKIFVEYGPWRAIRAITARDANGVEFNYTDYKVTRIQVTQTLIELGDTPYYGDYLKIEYTAGFMVSQVPERIQTIIFQLASIRFFNPDPSKQEIPQFIYNQINRL